MATNPELFKSMSVSEIVATLAMDEATDLHRRASSIGARCVACLDTGLDRAGTFCGCLQGGRLARQGNKA
jgi:hypothetical protein